MNTQKIKILLADDHQLVRKGFRALLEELDFVEVVGEAANGREVVSLLRGGLRPHIVLLDYEMPLQNGLETAAVLQQEFFGLKVIMLTMKEDKQLIEQAVAAGVRGFLFKNTSPETLTEALRHVFAGETYFSNDVTLALLRPSAAPDAHLLALLSNREIEIIRLVAQGLSSAEIGQQLFISPRTVDTHRNNILQKIEVPGIAGIVQFAIRNKLLS